MVWERHRCKYPTPVLMPNMVSTKALGDTLNLKNYDKRGF